MDLTYITPSKATLELNAIYLTALQLMATLERQQQQTQSNPTSDEVDKDAGETSLCNSADVNLDSCNMSIGGGAAEATVPEEEDESFDLFFSEDLGGEGCNGAINTKNETDAEYFWPFPSVDT
jgi:hypothetical protein